MRENEAVSDMEDFHRLVEEFMDAPKDQAVERLMRIYEHPFIRGFAEVLLSPQAQLAKEQTAKYEQFLFRDGALEIDHEAVVNNLIQGFRNYYKIGDPSLPETIRESAEYNYKETIEGMHEYLDEDLQWAKKFNRLIPVHWWYAPSNTYPPSSPSPNTDQITYDFGIAEVFEVQLSPTLTDAAISLGVDEITIAVAKSQYLDFFQFAFALHRIHEKCLSVAYRVDEIHRLEAVTNWERNFDEFQERFIQAQETRDVDRKIIDIGLQTYQELRTGVMHPAILQLQRERFVPEYLP